MKLHFFSSNTPHLFKKYINSSFFEAHLPVHSSSAFPLFATSLAEAASGFPLQSGLAFGVYLILQLITERHIKLVLKTNYQINTKKHHKKDKTDMFLPSAVVGVLHLQYNMNNVIGTPAHNFYASIPTTA